MLRTVFCLLALIATSALAQEKPEKPDTRRGDRLMADSLRVETQRLAGDCLADVHTLKDWTDRRDEYRRQLLEMLGLDPLPEKTDLKPVITGRVEHDGFVVEKL